MKKILFILFFVFSLVAHAQFKVDILEFQGSVTTAIRNGFDVPAGKTWMIHNVTNNKLEIAGDDDVWTTVGDGIQEGTNSIPTGITMAQGLTNYIQVGPENSGVFNNNPYIRFVAGNQANAVYFVMTDNQVTLSGYTIAEIDAASGVSVVTKEWVDAKLAIKENSLGSPPTNGYILSSLTDGTRSWVSNSSGSDNLGNHTATQDLDMGNFEIDDVKGIIFQHLTGVTPLEGGMLYDATDNRYIGFADSARKKFLMEGDDITDHTLLTNIGTNSHAQIDTHIADGTTHFTQAGISITESQISDLGAYLTDINGETLNDLNGVALASPTNGQVLKYNGTNWVNDTDDTGGGGGNPNKLNGVKLKSGTSEFLWSPNDFVDVGLQQIVRKKDGGSQDGQLEDSDMLVNQTGLVQAIGSTIVNYVSDGDNVIFTDLDGNTGNEWTVTNSAVSFNKESAISIIVNGGTVSTRSFCTADPNEQHTVTSADSDPNCNETNVVASNWAATNNVTISTVADVNGTSDYSTTLTSAAAGISFGRLEFSVTNGDTFDVDIVAERVGSAGVPAQMNFTGASGWSTSTLTQSPVTYSGSITATATGTMALRAYPQGNASGIGGVEIRIISYSLIKTN